MGWGNVGLQIGSVYTIGVSPLTGDLYAGGVLQYQDGPNGADGSRGIAIPAGMLNIIYGQQTKFNLCLRVIFCLRFLFFFFY